MLASTLGWYRGNRAFDQFQQGLLYAFAGNITRNRGVIRLARNLVDFVNVYDALLRTLYVVVAFLQKLLDNIFNILANVASLGQGGCVGNGKRYVQHARERFRQQGFT